MKRRYGVKDYVAHAGRGRIHQLAFGDWSYADGARKAAVLLARYPDTNIIWAAQKFDHTSVVHGESVSRFNDVALKRSESPDFRGYSKALNPEPGPYDFRLTRLLGPGSV